MSGYMDFSLSGSPYSSQFGTQTSMNTGIKKTCSRRSWSLLEERVLINAFRDIIASGWKTPNGFRTGFIPQLEARMKHALPNTDLRGDPHIISKYGSWKKTFHEAYTVLNNSGMGWNSTTKTVQATPEYWDSLDQSYLHLSYIREKPFPFYEVWLEMYGKDTATGNNAFDFQGAANHVPITQAMEEVEDNTNGSPINNHVDQPGASQSATPLSNQQGIPNKGKRKRNDLGDDIVDVMSSHWTKATEAVLEVAQAMKTEMLATKNRKKLCEALRLLPITLTRAERVRAISVLAKQKDQMDVFFELSDEEKCDLVHLALDNHIRD